jgi:hypothetical protein
VPTAPLIHHIRVSTSSQGRSGLGIEAQRHPRLLRVLGGIRGAREFVEGTGKGRARPQTAIEG